MQKTVAEASAVNTNVTVVVESGWINTLAHRKTRPWLIKKVNFSYEILFLFGLSCDQYSTFEFRPELSLIQRRASTVTQTRFWQTRICSSESWYHMHSPYMKCAGIWWCMDMRRGGQKIFEINPRSHIFRQDQFFFYDENFFISLISFKLRSWVASACQQRAWERTPPPEGGVCKTMKVTLFVCCIDLESWIYLVRERLLYR